MVVSCILESPQSLCQINHDYVDPPICSQAGVRNMYNRYIYKIKSERMNYMCYVRAGGSLSLCIKSKVHNKEE